VNCRKRMTKVSVPKPLKQSTAGANANPVQKTGGDKPTDFRVVPETPKTTGKVVKYGS